MLHHELLLLLLLSPSDCFGEGLLSGSIVAPPAPVKQCHHPWIAGGLGGNLFTTLSTHNTVYI